MEHYKETGEKLHGREARTQALPPTQLHGMARSVCMFTQIKTETTVIELTKRLGKDTASIDQSQRAKSAKNNHLSYGGKGKLRLSLFLCPALPPGSSHLKLEKTSKQKPLLAWASAKREPALPPGSSHLKLEKTSKQFIGPLSFL